MGVIPLCVACSSSDKDPITVGIDPAILDGSPEADAPSVGIVIGVPDASDTDASSVGIRPAIPDAGADSDAAPVGIIPAIPDASPDAG